MNDGELLARIAVTLRKEIGPAVAEQYPKTQAFMASVVAQKLGRQLQLAPQHARDRARDFEALVSELDSFMETCSVDTVNAAIQCATADRDDTNLARLIETLYAERSTLGEEKFAVALSAVRGFLRSDIDRRMEVAQ